MPFEGVKKIICATFCSKLRKQNNDSQNRQKLICFSCIQITYSYIFYYFTRHDIFETYEVPKLIYCVFATDILLSKGNALESTQCAFEYYLMYIYFQRCFKFYSIFCSCRIISKLWPHKLTEEWNCNQQYVLQSSRITYWGNMITKTKFT